MSSLSIEEKAARLANVRWRPDRGSFLAECPICAGTLAVSKAKTKCLQGCGDDLITAFFGNGKGHTARAKSGNSEPESGEPPRAEDVNGAAAKARRGSGLNDQVAQVRTWIDNNPEAAFASILNADLIHRAGSKELYAHCPFHDDSHASFRINLEKRAWFCDPCGKGGDAIGLVRTIWGVDFEEVTGRLLRLAGLNGFHRTNEGAAQAGHTEEPKAESARNKDRKEIRRLRYDVRDLEGTLKATHIRIEYDDGSKSMPWDPAGVKPAELPLYGINRTFDSKDCDAVIVCEGEKAADSLWDRRTLAVGTVTGAGLNKPIPIDDSLRPLLRFRVYLWPDNDDVGREHMERIAQQLTELGHTDLWKIRCVGDEHDDAADFEGDVAALVDSAEAADPYPDRQVIDAYRAFEIMQTEHRDYALEGLIRFGSSGLLTGLMEAGKSTFARNLARAWALNLPFFGRATQQSSVLVVVSSKEYESWAETIGFWNLRDHIFLAESTSVHFNGPEPAAGYIEYRMRQFNCRCLVLDTLFDYVGLPASGTANADQNRVVMNEQAPLLDMIRRRGFALLALGHQPKGEARNPDPRDPQESFAGHTGWSAQHRMRLSMRRKAQGVISFITGRGSPGDKGFEEERLVFYDEKTRLLTLGGLFKDHLEELAAPSIIEILKSIGVPCGITKIIDEVGKGEKWVRAGLRGARKQGLVLMEGKGKNTKYALTE